MAKSQVVVSDHAEDFGGVIAEPGDPVPEGADPDVVARLGEEGKLGDAPAKREDK